MNFLSGFKTYLVGVLTIVGGGYQIYHGDLEAGFQTVMLGCGMITGRAAVAKIGQV